LKATSGLSTLWAQGVAVISEKDNIRLRIEEYGIIPSIKPKLHTAAADDFLFAAEALNSAGIPIVEINMAVPGALNAISQLVKRFPKMTVGVDLLDVETADRCLEAGAKFLTSPAFVPELVEFAVKTNVAIFPGALTPSEVFAAWKSGADCVKIFPSSQVGGPGYIRALHSPFPGVRLIASGGVTLETAGAFIFSGATALGIGSQLVPPEALRSRRQDLIQELARRFTDIVKSARTEK
jgi:2-dehydro-3-deoxyphosphogluconate aldolase/(4S)-4-hydroxy-2-oxoglutarate aldolase